MGDQPSRHRSFAGLQDTESKRPRGGAACDEAGARPATYRTILVVDGNQATRGAIVELLTDSEFIVHAADGMREMERICQRLSQPPELSLLEFRLHDGRGDGAAAWLRVRWATLPIVYLSCVRPEHDAALRTALLAPATALLMKPTSFDAIMQAVARR